MASVIYNEFKRASAAGEIDLNVDDIRLKLLMNNTTADTENDGIVAVADFTTLAETAGANADNQKALANEAVNKDDANDRAEFDADDPTWPALGNGANPIQGALVFKRVDGNDANDLVIAFIDFAADQSPGGSDFTINFDAEGILQLA